MERSFFIRTIPLNGIMKKARIPIAIMMAMLICITFTPLQANAVTYKYNFDRSVLPATPQTTANEWQIVSKSFPGLYKPQGMDVSQGFDEAANVAYTSDQNVRMSNTIIGTGTENEFLMYTCIEPRVSWADILRLNTVIVSNNNSPISPPNYPSGGGTSYLLPEKTGSYTHPVTLNYYAMVDGNRVDLATTVMYGKQQSVKNCGAGIGNPLFGEGSFVAHRDFDFVSGPGATPVEVDITKLYSKYEFVTDSVYSKTVTEEPKSYIDIYPNSFNYDGDSCSYNSGSNTITWNLPKEDLGLLPYHTDENGYTTPEGVLRVMDNGKATYYRQEAYQRTYKFSLDVTEEDFEPATAVQVTESPQDASKAASIFYNVGKTGSSLEGFLNPNTVLGYLYDLEFEKVVQHSEIPLENVKFKLERIKGDGSGTRSDTRQYTFQYEGEDANIEISKFDGSVKFHDMPWGYYRLTEMSLDPSNKFQQTYLVEAERGKLPKIIRANEADSCSDNGDAAVGLIIRGFTYGNGYRKPSDVKDVDDGYLTNDHASGHAADFASDAFNKLYTFQPDNGTKRKGFVENEPYTADIVIKKNVDKYDKLTDKLKVTAFDIKLNDKSDDSDNVAVYSYPDIKATSLDKLDDGKAIKHYEVDGNTLLYKIIVPRGGAFVQVEETLKSAQRKSFKYKDTSVSGNCSSVSKLSNKKHGREFKVEAGQIAAWEPSSSFLSYDNKNLTNGNELPASSKQVTAIIKNTPITKLYLRKVISNSPKNHLANDEFIIELDSNDLDISTDVVLKDGEKSAAISIEDTGELNLKEVVPMEYEKESVVIEEGTASINGDKLIITKLGYDVVVKITNKYDWKPYFHDFDTKANEFRYTE